MADIAKPTFLVDPTSDPVLVRIDGRASFQNSAGLRDFILEMLKQGRARFVIDFLLCTSMDSTFLGVLAGAAMEMRKLPQPGSLVLSRMSQRNLELVRNLGLHRLLTIDADDQVRGSQQATVPLARQAQLTEVEHARLVLEAHENLVSADASNQAKFQDVLSFLRSRVQQG